MQPTEAWLREHFKVAEVQGDEYRCFCPLHQDGQKPSLYVNLARRLWKCHVKCGGGKLESLAKKAKTPPPPEGEAVPVPKDRPTKYVPPEELAAARSRFWKAGGKSAREYLASRGITSSVMRKFGLGLGEDNRVWIPVTDHTGGCCNVRRYDWTHTSKSKFEHYAEGFGTPVRLWPYGIVEKEQEVLLLEGELDVLLAHSLGLDHAVTTTGGAGAWDHSFTRALAGKLVVVAYDIDDAGRQGAAKVGQALRLFCKRVVVANLPISEPPNGDFTDYVRAVRGDRKVVHDFLRDCWPKDAPTEAIRFGALPGAEPEKRLALRAVVSGKDLTPFNVPSEIACDCAPLGKGPCLNCPIASSGGRYKQPVPVAGKIVLKSVMSPDSSVVAAVKEEWNLPARCPGAKISVSKTVPLWDLRLSPDVDSGEEEGADGSRRAFSMRNLEMNQPYDLELAAVSDPKTQYALLHVMEAKSSLTSIEQWKSEGKSELLRIWEVRHDGAGGTKRGSGKPGGQEAGLHLRPGGKPARAGKDPVSQEVPGKKDARHRA